MYYCWPLELIISALQLCRDTIVDCVTDFETQVDRRKFLRSLFLAIFMCFAVTYFLIKQRGFPCWELISMIFRKSRSNGFDNIFGF